VTISVQHSEKLSLEQVRKFLKASKAVSFAARNRAEGYAWVTRILRQHGYPRLAREAKGVVRRYLEKRFVSQ